jgi:cytochrome P450
MSEHIRTSIELFGGNETDPVPNPYPAYRTIRDEKEPALIQTLMSASYMITRYDDVRAVFQDDALFSSRVNADGIGAIMGSTIIEMDGKEHDRHRNLIAPALSPRALRGDIEASAKRIANEIIDEFIEAGSADLIRQFTFTFPLRVFFEILGIPSADHEQLHQWGISFTRVGTDPQGAIDAAQAMGKYLMPVVEDRRKTPTGDLICRLANAEVEGKSLEGEEISSFLRLLVVAGAETTYHLIGSTVSALLNNPDQFETVRSDRSRLLDAINETLRWESPVQMVMRETTEETKLGGMDIPKGASLFIAVGSANRDERQFKHPDRFDIDRTPNDHVAFGLGRHYCAGSRLAYLEATVGLNALFDRLGGLRLAPGETGQVVGLAFRGPDSLKVQFEPSNRLLS